MNRQKVLLILVTSFVTIIFLSLTVVQAFSVPLFAPIVITFGSSSEVQASTETVLGLYPDAQVIKYEDIGNIFNVLTLMRSNSQLILIGHGSNNGILNAEHEIIPWEKIAQWVNTLPNTEVYFISCDSYAVTKLINKPSVGFTGVVDGPMAADMIAIRDNLIHNMNINTNNAYINLMERINALDAGAKPQYMIDCGPFSPISSSSQVNSQTISPESTCPPPPPPPQPKTIQSSLLGSCTLQPSDPLYNSPPNYYVYCAGTNEMNYWELRMVIDLLFATVIPLAKNVLNSGEQAATSQYLYQTLIADVGNKLFTFLVDLYHFSNNQISIQTLLWDSISDLSYVLGAGFAALTSFFSNKCLDWQLDYCAADAIMAASAALQIYLAFQTGGLTLVNLLVGYSATIGFDGSQFLIDALDTNDVPHG